VGVVVVVVVVVVVDRVDVVDVAIEVDVAVVALAAVATGVGAMVLGPTDLASSVEATVVAGVVHIHMVPSLISTGYVRWLISS
jgi:hypothetical protein